MDKKLIYIGFSFLHHGEHAGYDQVSKFVPYHKKVDCQQAFRLKMAIEKWPKILRNVYYRLFGDKLWWVELRLIVWSLFAYNKLHFHIIYGENIFRYLGYFKCKNKITLTLHQPPSYFEDLRRKKFKSAMKKVDKVIVMSKAMETYFVKEFPLLEVLFIPHGVDTAYFKPDTEKQDQILMVGNWLRDFKFASAVFDNIAKLDNKIKIKVISNAENHIYFSDKVECLSGISDAELLKKYQSSKLIFLPLTLFTANNALLEGCSCGCQVLVATAKENIEDDDSPIRFVEDNQKKVVDTIMSIITNWDNDNSSARDYILESYSWEQIGELTHAFLMRIEE